MKKSIITCACIALTSVSCASNSMSTEPNLLAFMEKIASQPLSSRDVKIARVSATAHAPEIEVVYLQHRNWCGSGGCTLWIIEKRNNHYALLRKVTIVQLPIRLLGRGADGYPIFGVWVHGGGIIRGYEVALVRRDGIYPGSASGPALPKGTKGVTLIPRLELR